MDNALLVRGPELNPLVMELIRRCLQKDRRRRWQAIGDVRIEIQQSLSDPGALTQVSRSDALTESPGSPKSTKSNSSWIVPWVAAALLLGFGVAWFFKPQPVVERDLARFEYELPSGQIFRNNGRNVLAFSPDGRRFVYNTTQGFYLRSLDTMAARLIPGTEEASTDPFFSPDGQWIAYYLNNEIRKISISGGAPVALCKAANPFGGSWAADGTILFGQQDGIMRVSANGGEPKLIVKADAVEQMHGPELLPDGDTILFTVTRAFGPLRWDQAQVVVQSLKSGKRKVVVQGGSDAHYIPTRHLMYALGDVLFAVPFDLKQLAVTGGAVPVIQGVQRAATPGANTAAANYGFARNGTLVYLVGAPDATLTPSVLAIADRSGAVRRLSVQPAQYRNPRVSPDGRQVAVESIDEKEHSSVWVYDLSGKSAIRRLTEEASNSTRPMWTPGSKRITYSSDRQKPEGIFWQPADGSGLPERLTTVEEGVQHLPESWSADGKVLSFAWIKGGLGGNSWGLWTLSRENGGKTQLFYDHAGSNEFGSVFSPDGKWIAYTSNEEASFGVYLQPYPPTGVKYLISRTGGAWPVWAQNGSELFYRLNFANYSVPKLNAVTITTKPVPSFGSETSVPMGDFLAFTNYRDYDIMPNGREFLILVPPQQAVSKDPIRLKVQVVFNWVEELKQRVQ